MKTILLGLLLAAGLWCAAAAEPESHGIAAPVSTRCGAVATVNQAGERLFLSFLADALGCHHLLMVNLDRGSSRTVALPGAPRSVDDRPFYFLLSSRNRLYTSYGRHYWEIDVESGKVLTHGKFSGYLTMGMTEDDRGRIWFVAYPQSEVGMLDPESGKFTDFGSIYKQDWLQYQRYVAADDAGWIYFGIGTTAPQVIGFDPVSRKVVEVFPEGDRGKAATGEVARDRNGKVYAWNRNRKDTPYYELHAGTVKKLAAKPEIKVPETAVRHGHQGAFIGEFPNGGKVDRLDLGERKLFWTDRDGVKRELALEYASNGAYLMGVAALPDGTIRGGSFHPMRYFTWDPKTKKYLEQGDARYQWNIVMPVGDHLFIGGYGEGVLLDWDTTQPYRGVPHPGRPGNPRNLGEATPAVHRPSSLCIMPDGNRVLMSGTPGYGRTGGGLVIYDRQADRREVIAPEALLTPESIHVMLPLNQDQVLLGTTIGAGTGGRVVAKEASLVLYDLKQRKILWREKPFPGARCFLGLQPLPGGKVLGAVWRDRLFVFDPATRRVEKVIPTGELGELVGTQGPRVLIEHGGRYFVFLRHAVAEYLPREGRLKLLARSSKEITAGGAVAGNRIYFCCNPELMSIPLPQ